MPSFSASYSSNVEIAILPYEEQIFKLVQSFIYAPLNSANKNSWLCKIRFQIPLIKF